jgi:hypothetical protein
MKKCLWMLSFGVLASIFSVGADAQVLPRNRTPFKVTVQAPTQTPAPKVTAATTESKELGPVACAVIRGHLRDEYRKQGMGVIERVRKANEATDDVINGLKADAERVAAGKVSGAKFGAIGDGKIWDTIVGFFKSPMGQALLQALMDLLIHSLGKGDTVFPHWYVLNLDTRDRISEYSFPLVV